MTAADFKDHFSTRSDVYARYRPGYPDELFAWLTELSPARVLAWDCATGTGQAAHALAKHFTNVVASDASAEQIRQAVPAANIEYAVAGAETMPLTDNSVDLITVAQALHWFDQTAFYTNAWRCLKPRGVLAVWNYNLATVEPAVDTVLHWYYHEIVGPYWPAERALVEQGYPPMPESFTPIAAQNFAMQAHWDMSELLGYLSTWSAGKYYQQTRQENPLDQLLPRLRDIWSDPAERKLVRWPLRLQVGRKQ